MTIKECYAAFGGAYDEVLARMAGMERMVTKFALKYLNDTTCAQMNEALDAGNYEEAFRMAHTLKGVGLNLGFTRLSESASALTEALRPGHEEHRTEAEIAPLRAEVNQYQAEVIAALSQLA